MALGHGVGDDLVTPSVALDDRLDQAGTLLVAGAVGIGEEREPSQRAVGAGRRVALVAECEADREASTTGIVVEATEKLAGDADERRVVKAHAG